MQSNRKFPWRAALGKGLLQGLYAAVLCLAAFFQLQHSCAVEDIWGEILLPYLALSLATLGAASLIFSLPWKRVSTGGIVFSAIASVLAIANYDTLALHGTILTVEQMGNARTALAVIGNYNLFSPALLQEAAIQGAVFLGCLGLSLAERRLLEKRPPPVPHSLALRRAVSGVLILAAIALLFSQKARPYLKTVRNSWEPTVTVQYYGYPLILLSATVDYELSPPDGYSQDALEAIASPEAESTDTTPADILLILNETFYDPSQVAEISTDISYLSQIAAMPGALVRHAVAQSAGGTNTTEFELLTSNPQSLVGGTPFNLLNMEDTASLVSVLKAQGYYTIGTHCQSGVNYHRDEGYTGLGFDEIHFVQDYTELDIYGDRPWPTDESVYANLLHWYEAAQATGGPVFAYCLTMQNHGGWDVNPPEEDLVHLVSYTGSGSEDELNEYLSCLSLSDQAFVSLCDALRDSERRVIVCMIGDHSPSFIDSIVTRDLGEQEEIVKASVPLVIWANFPLEESAVPEALSATAVGPLVLKLAGADNSAFYRYILALSEEYPVITGWGEAVDTAGNVISYQSRSPENQAIWNYLYLAYNNLLPDSMDSWFTVGS